MKATALNRLHIGKNHTFLKPDKSLPTGVWSAAVLCAILVFNLLFAGPWVFAQEGDAAKKIRDQAEFSVVNTSGNTDVSTPKNLFIGYTQNLANQTRGCAFALAAGNPDNILAGTQIKKQLCRTAYHQYVYLSNH